MIWTFVILIVGYVIYKFFNSLEQDKDDLNNQKLSEKFSAIINMLNDAAFNGKGDINIEDSRNLNIYENDSNQIVELQYSTGSLSITWKYKYYQKEVVYKKNFPDSRNLSIFEQKSIANRVIDEMKNVVFKHKNEVLGIEHPIIKIKEDIQLENPYSPKLKVHIETLIEDELDDVFRSICQALSPEDRIEGFSLFLKAFEIRMLSSYEKTKSYYLEHKYDFPYSVPEFEKIVKDSVSSFYSDKVELFWEYEAPDDKHFFDT